MQRDLDTLLLVLHGLGVDVVLASVIDWACPEISATVIHSAAVWTDGEAIGWGSTFITLPPKSEEQKVSMFQTSMGVLSATDWVVGGVKMHPRPALS